MLYSNKKLKLCKHGKAVITRFKSTIADYTFQKYNSRLHQKACFGKNCPGLCVLQRLLCQLHAKN